MKPPNSPDGYLDYTEYSFPRWSRVSARVALLALAVGIIYSGSIILTPDDPNLYILGFGIGAGVSLFIHVVLHYVTAAAFGYDPAYVWPNRVYVPGESLPVKHIIPVLLAPQLLSIVYLSLLLSGMSLTLEVIIGWGLLLNIQGAWSDVLWSIRRLTWPTGTRVVVEEDQSTYVAFPEETV